LGFVYSKVGFFLLRHRLWRGWLCSEELLPKTSDCFGVCNNLINSLLDLHKRRFSVFVKLAPLLDCGNTSIGGKEDGNRVNF
jgi:hypothetical protein